MNNYVIIDLEMCHIPKKSRHKSLNCGNELIQLGAVLLNHNLKIVDSFTTYVSPIFGVIDTYIERLTGITENHINNAPSFESALKMFLSWLPQNSTIVSWSNSDKAQLQKESELKNIKLDSFNSYLATWIDCQDLFAKKMHTSKKYKLSEALIISDINFKDGEHNALIDAYNTALLFSKIESEPELKLSSYYCTENNITTTFHPFAHLLTNINTY